MTAPTIDALAVRRALGRAAWGPPVSYGPDGFAYLARDRDGSIVVTAAEHEDGVTWVHASIAHPDRMPSYEELAHLHRAVFGDNGWSYQVFAPVEHHVNIHEYALHLWGRQDGTPLLPNFGYAGTI